MLYQKPEGNLHDYQCVRCGYSPLIPVFENPPQRNAFALNLPRFDGHEVYAA